MSTKSAKPSDETRFDRLERWFRNEPIISVLILIGVAITGIGEVVKHGSDLMISVGLKQEKTLELATDTAKAEFSRHLIELAWRRIFWSRNFVRRVELNRPSTELDYSWNKYLDSAADWSAEIMVNINGLDQYYGKSDKPQQFAAIQKDFLKLEDMLVKLRTSDADTTPRQISEIKALLDQVNVNLYFFVLNRGPE